MIVTQTLIAGILAKTFPKNLMIRQEGGRHIEFGVLTARVAHDLNKAMRLHDQVCQINADIAALYLEKRELLDKCEHCGREPIRDYVKGTETISCQVCGKVFNEGEVNDCRSKVIRTILAQVLVDNPNLDELAEHIFTGMRDYTKTARDLTSLLKTREAEIATHRQVLEFNQDEIDTVRSNCSHVVTERVSHGCFGRSVCIACGTEVSE